MGILDISRPKEKPPVGLEIHFLSPGRLSLNTTQTSRLTFWRIIGLSKNVRQRFTARPSVFVMYSVIVWMHFIICLLWMDKACCWQRCASQTPYGRSSTLVRTMTDLGKIGYISFCLAQLLSPSISMKVFVTNYNFTGFVSDELEFEGLTFKSDRLLPDKKFAEMTICFRINIDFFNVMGQYSSILELSGDRVSKILKFVRAYLN